MWLLFCGLWPFSPEAQLVILSASLLCRRRGRGGRGRGRRELCVLFLGTKSHLYVTVPEKTDHPTQISDVEILVPCCSPCLRSQNCDSVVNKTIIIRIALRSKPEAILTTCKHKYYIPQVISVTPMPIISQVRISILSPLFQHNSLLSVPKNYASIINFVAVSDKRVIPRKRCIL